MKFHVLHLLVVYIHTSFVYGMPLNEKELSSIVRKDVGPDPVTDFPEIPNYEDVEESIFIPLIPIIALTENIEKRNGHKVADNESEKSIQKSPNKESTTPKSQDSDHEILMIANSEAFKESKQVASNSGNNVVPRSVDESISRGRIYKGESIKKVENMDTAESGMVLIPLFTYRSQLAKRKRRYTRFGSSEENDDPYDLFYYRPSRSSTQEKKQKTRKKGYFPDYYETATYSYVF